MVLELGGANAYIQELEEFQKLTKQKTENVHQFISRFENKGAYMNWLAKIMDEEPLTTSAQTDQLRKAIPKQWLGMAKLNAIKTRNYKELKAFLYRAEESAVDLGKDFQPQEKRYGQRQNANFKKTLYKYENFPKTNPHSEKWCKHHRTTIHNTEDCRAKERLQAEKEE